MDSGSRAHVRVSDAASLPSPRNAAGHGRSENPSKSPRAAQKEGCIYRHDDVVSIEIGLFPLKLQFPLKCSFLRKGVYDLGTFFMAIFTPRVLQTSLASAICCDRRAPRGSANRAPKDSHPPREWMHGL